MVKRLSVLVGFVFGVLLVTALPAHAHHNTVAWERAGSDCGETTFTTSWNESDHQVTNTVLVVQVNGEQFTTNIGGSITVGPFDTEQATIRWRIWGGGERAGDDPPLDNLDALLDYLEAYPGGELDADPPGVAWRNRTVNGCPANPTPSASPTMEPTPEPSPSATSPEPSESQAAGVAGGKPDLPVTGFTPLPLALGGLAFIGAGSGLVWWLTRRQAPTFTA